MPMATVMAMQHDAFTGVFKHVVAHVGALLVSKNDEYSRNDDKLHNFTRAAAYLGCSTLHAAQGMKAKHTISLADMIDDIDRGIHHPKEVWLEKFGDEIAYSICMFGLLHDLENWEVELCTTT